MCSYENGPSNTITDSCILISEPNNSDTQLEHIHLTVQIANETELDDLRMKRSRVVPPQLQVPRIQKILNFSDILYPTLSAEFRDASS
jgi:hypothetical protein